MGLDQNDVIVRRRLAQKLEFMIRDIAVPDEPPEPELQAFLADNAERYREPARMSFTHVYFSSDRRPEAAADAETLLAELRAAEAPPERAAGKGDPFMFHFDHAGRSLQEVSKHFGNDFARALFELEPDGAFGLLHGFGFAGALSEVGLPQGQIPATLFLFNVGVEIGQLAFVATLGILFLAVRRFLAAPPAWVRALPAYGIGSVASFWVIERVAAFF